jgi:hypothetical protein
MALRFFFGYAKAAMEASKIITIVDTDTDFIEKTLPGSRMSP